MAVEEVSKPRFQFSLESSIIEGPHRFDGCQLFEFCHENLSSSFFRSQPPEDLGIFIASSYGIHEMFFLGLNQREFTLNACLPIEFSSFPSSMFRECLVDGDFDHFLGNGLV